MKPPTFASPSEADAWLAKNGVAIELWHCKGPVYEAENRDRILYSTERLSSGKFGVAVFKYDDELAPIEWTWTYVREFVRRKDAKAMAGKLYKERSPKYRAKHARAVAADV